jgi:hypothetical protein
MKQVHRWSGLVGVLGLLTLCACGGGSTSGNSSSGSGSSGTAPTHDFAAGGNNVVAMTVQDGPSAQGFFNQPLVSVTVCNPMSHACVTVNDVLVDTGSYGLRLMASTVASIGLTAMADPNHASNTIHECLPFADGYAWGAVSNATVSLGGETTSGATPIQVIDDSTTPSPAVPSSCSNSGSGLDSVDSLGANGILGVGVLAQDCGPGCSASLDIYYSCAGSGTCSPTNQALADQVTNPVADFAADNNGVILQLPSIGSSGSVSASGYLVFGIGTETNNTLGSAQVFTTDSSGNFQTTFDGSTLGSSFIDSGSNALFFEDSALAPFECYSNQFYCPTATTSLTATNTGENGVTNNVTFYVANLKGLSGSNFAFDDVGGPAPSIPNFGSYFDWGVPFFYGRTIFFALDGVDAAGTTGPYYAY